MNNLITFIGKSISFEKIQKTIKIVKLLNKNHRKHSYFCIDEKSNNSYLLKIFFANDANPKEIIQIKSELFLLNRIKIDINTNILNLIDIKITNDIYFILYEYANQKNNLQEQMKKLKKDNLLISELDIWKIIYQISLGIYIIHKQGFIYRNLTPENILIINDNLYKISNFEFCTNKNFENFNQYLKSEYSIKGELQNEHFLPPELIGTFENFPLNQKIDVWSIGVILFHLMFDFIPICNEIKFITGNEINFYENINKYYPNNKLLILLKMTIVNNPNQRCNVIDIINFIENVNNCKYIFAYNKIDLKSQLIGKNVQNLNINNNCDILDNFINKYLFQDLNNYSLNFIDIKNLLVEIWRDNNFINRLYFIIQKNFSLQYYLISAIKGIILIHYIIFLGSKETIIPNNNDINNKSNNILNYINYLHLIWYSRLINMKYDIDDIIIKTNINKIIINNFLVIYLEIIIKKIEYHLKYKDVINNNYSINIKNQNQKVFYTALIENNFIIDSLKLFSDLYTFLNKIPIFNKNYSNNNKDLLFKIYDIISQIINQELYELFNLLFFVITAYKYYYYSREHKYNILTVFDNYFLGVSKKSTELLQKLQIIRNENKSQRKIILFTAKVNNFEICYEYISNLNNFFLENPKSILKYDEENLKLHFNAKELFGFELNENIGNLLKTKKFDEYFTKDGEIFIKIKNAEEIKELLEKMQNEFSDLKSSVNKENKENKENNENKTNKKNNENKSEDSKFSEDNNSNEFNQNFFYNNDDEEVNENTFNTISTTKITVNESNNDITDKNKNTFNNNNNNLELSKTEYITKNSIYESNNITKINDENSKNLNIELNIFKFINIFSSIKNSDSNDTENIDESSLNKLIIDKISDFINIEIMRPQYHWIIKSSSIKIIKNIGEGSSSEVYLGDYHGTPVAIKKFIYKESKEDNLKEYKREISTLNLLHHPNLVIFMGVIAEKNNISIVTEYCEGGTLFELLSKKNKIEISWELKIKILLEIAIGMNFLHSNNPPILHRDLKSLNILLTDKIEKKNDTTNIKISDFGLSRFYEKSIRMSGHLGTCHWMAPELIESKNYGTEVDVYSYGIIIWEICSEKTPYNNMSQQQVQFYVSVKKGRPDLKVIPIDTPPKLIKLMKLCWEQDPGKRPNFEFIIEFLKSIDI